MLKQNELLLHDQALDNGGLPGEILGFDEYVEVVGNKRTNKLIAIVKTEKGLTRIQH